jgi:hypothetical protein
LKSPDSEKQKKANESVFIFMGFRWLWFACGYLAAEPKLAPSRAVRLRRPRGGVSSNRVAL